MRGDPINPNDIMKSSSNEIEGLELTHQGGGAYGRNIGCGRADTWNSFHHSGGSSGGRH